MKILVVDDNAYILELVKHFLKGGDYVVECASNVASAIGILDTQKGFSLVITDIIMPGEDGTKLARYVKENYGSIPVLAITGGVENAVEDFKNYADMFADETLAKPFKPDELIGAIERLTKSQKCA